MANADYENVALQRAAIEADKERTNARTLGFVATVVTVILGGLVAYGCSSSHEYDLKEQAAVAATREACVKAGSNWMPIQKISKSANGTSADVEMGCVTQQDFAAVQQSNANIVRAFAGQ